MRIPGEPVLYENLGQCAAELTKEICAAQGTVFSDGERCDSLLYDGPNFPVTDKLLPVFLKCKDRGNRWLRLTKTANVDHLLSLDHQKVMLLSYSINPQQISELFEKNQVATIAERLAAARRGQDAGYPTRFRIDPIITLPGWEQLYLDLLNQMKSCGLNPEVITLGTYRVIERSLPSFKMLGDGAAVDLVQLIPTGNSAVQRRLRYADELRKRVYQHLLERIREIFPTSRIGLCKETRSMRAELGFTGKDTACNCTIL
jgi:DNA repair photolyase